MTPEIDVRHPADAIAQYVADSGGCIPETAAQRIYLRADAQAAATVSLIVMQMVGMTRGEHRRFADRIVEATRKAIEEAIDSKRPRPRRGTEEC